MITVPSHVKECVVIRSWKPEDETQPEGRGYLTGSIRCSCGSESFEFLFPGPTHIYKGQEIPVSVDINGTFFFVIRARCAACGKEYSIFDSHYHGWDGFVCHDPVKASLPRPPLVLWHCRTCGGDSHNATIVFMSEGKEDFIEGAGGKFSEDQWMDGFGWMDISLTCSTCGRRTEQWVSYEAM